MDGKLMLVSNVADLSPAEIAQRYKALADRALGLKVMHQSEGQQADQKRAAEPVVVELGLTRFQCASVFGHCVLGDRVPPLRGRC